jgi:kynurenine formamidase
VTSLVDAVRACRVIDASPTIRTDMAVFPGHPRVSVEAARTHDNDGYFLQTLSIGEHSGSHVDAPAHALAARPSATIDAFPVARFVAPYALFDLSALHLAPGELATAGDLDDAARRDALELRPGDAALVCFGRDPPGGERSPVWAANAPGLAEDACAYLADASVGLVGSDTTTCDTAVRDGAIISAHGHLTYFLPNDILIVEGLCGLRSAPRRGVFVGAPLKIAGGSGSPIRALLLVEADT